MANPSSSPREAGFFNSIRTLAGSVLDLLHVRIELFSVELQEAQEHGKQLVVLAAGGAMLLTLGLLLLTFFIVVLFWDSYRLLSIAIVTALYLGGGAVCLWRAHNLLQNRPSPLGGSLREFVEDLKQLKLHEAEARDSDTGNTVQDTANGVSTIDEKGSAITPNVVTKAGGAL